ncbi:MAG: hypothetical protein CM1200mP20_04650 [Pseudomonadota bacterium]|nr:MAG: hypothetical protein CM1200mP20_04650 [Pseudomonadota bacterium]
MTSNSGGSVAPPMVELRDVSKRFIKTLDFAGRLAQKIGVDVHEEVVHAVDGVSLSIYDGEVVGLVGESGFGKSTFWGGSLPACISPLKGKGYFRGTTLDSMSGSAARDAALSVQMIFQDPMSSLNPRRRVIDIIGEAPLVHGVVDRSGMEEHVKQAMLRVGLDPDFMRRFPHQFSGGPGSGSALPGRWLSIRNSWSAMNQSRAPDVSIQAQVLIFSCVCARN